MKLSFSAETKNSLCAIRVKKRCCRTALLHGILLFSGAYKATGIRTVTENERTSQTLIRLYEDLGIKAELSLQEKKTSDGEPYSSYKITVTDGESLRGIFSRFGEPGSNGIPASFACPECARHLARGIFLSAGSIADPKSGFHLDITSGNAALCDAVSDFLIGEGLHPKRSNRRKQEIVYFKGSESIGDFLTYIGAPKAALSVIDASIYREIRNQENRHSNCDTANISRTTGSASKVRRAVKRLRETGLFEQLDDDLKMTATLREENPTVSLQELAELHTPPISKSGVHHRIRKLLALAEEITDRV